MTHVILNKQVVGKEFKRDAKLITEFFENATMEEKAKMAAVFAESKELPIDCGVKQFVMKEAHLDFNIEKKMRMEEKYVPHVIEPSFGIGRIVYCIFEHCFKVRAEDAQRTFFDFPSKISPVKTSLLPLMN